MSYLGLAQNACVAIPNTLHKVSGARLLVKHLWVQLSMRKFYMSLVEHVTAGTHGMKVSILGARDSATLQVSPSLLVGSCQHASKIP